VATVAAPAYQLIALEQPPLDSASRAALARAFDLSTALDGLVQRAAWRSPHGPLFTARPALRRTSYRQPR
jgi:hypothetical protein